MISSLVPPPPASTTTQLDASAPLDPASYAWKESPHSCSVWQRRALGTESSWFARPKFAHEIFVEAILTLESPVLISTLETATRRSWQQLRFAVPELGVNSTCGDDGVAYMQYQVPSSEEAEKWIDRTFAFENAQEFFGFKELMGEVVLTKIGHDSDKAFLLVRAKKEREGNELVEQVQIMLNLDHQITDGIGSRILLNEYLTLLALELDNPTSPSVLNWQENHKNLSPPWVTVMNSDQLLSGSEYEIAFEHNSNHMMCKMPYNPGLALLETVEPPTLEFHFITLTETQSSSLVQAIKHLPGPKANITHLGHAAMILATLRSCSLPDPIANFHGSISSPCWLNGRRYLKDFKGHPEPTKSYVPICQSYHPISITDLKNMLIPASAKKEEIKDILVQTCKVTTAEYWKLKERKSVLPEVVVMMEWFGRQACLASFQSSKTPSVPSPPILPTLPNSKPKTMQDPIFQSDGITEQYISHSYSSPSSAPKKMFEVNDVKFAANGRELVVRMSSWRGCTTILGEWSGAGHDREMVVRFLEDMVAIMLSIVE